MYQIIRIYEDGAYNSEHADVLSDVLGACAIYAADPTLKALEIWQLRPGREYPDCIMEWTK